MTRYISLAGEMFSQSAAEEIGIYDCAENGAGTCQNVDYIDELRARAEAAEAEVARPREALELAEAEVERLLSELSDAVDGHWDAEPSWYADKALTASPYADGAYDNTTE